MCKSWIFFNFLKKFKKTVDKKGAFVYIIICKVQRALNKIKIKKCASGSGVEYNLAKVGVAGSNPVSRSAGNRNV